MTRADLAPLTADLPAEPAAVSPPSSPSRRSRPAPVPVPFPVPGACGRGGGRGSVGAWAAASLVNVIIWVAVTLGSAGFVYPWWIWVAGPWGLVLALGALARRHGPRRLEAA